MTFSEAHFESMRELIPLYVKGLLPASRRADIENAAEKDARLKLEIEHWRKIHGAYEVIGERIPHPSPAAYPRIAAVIREQHGTGFFGRFAASRKIPLAFIAVQFLVIIALGIYIIQTRAEYRTLSVPQNIINGPVKIHIVFRENATEAEIRNLLLQVHARIISGPSRSGLYLIEIPSGEDADKRLGILQNAVIVEIAEKSY